MITDVSIESFRFVTNQIQTILETKPGDRTDEEIQTLLSELHEGGDGTRGDAAEALLENAREDPSKIHEEVGLLVRALEDEEYTVRWNVTRILKEVAKDSPTSVTENLESITAAIPENNIGISSNLSDLLAHILPEATDGRQRALSVAAEYRDHWNWRVRKKVIPVYRFCRGREAVSYLEELLNDEKVAVRKDAVKAIYKVSDRDPAAVPPAFETLERRVSEDEDAMIQETSAKVFRKVTGEVKVAELPIAAFIDILTQTQHPGKPQISGAVYDIAQRKPETMEPYLDELIAALSHGDCRVQSKLLEVFEPVGISNEALVGDILPPVINKLSADETTCDDGAYESGRDSYRVKPYHVRKQAAKTLGTLGHHHPNSIGNSIDPLIKRLSDDHYRVRKAALSALEEINEQDPSLVPPSALETDISRESDIDNGLGNLFG